MGKSWLLKEAGVACVNPSAPENERIYRKVFAKKKIYLPMEYDRAVANHLSGKDVFVLGQRVVSSASPDQWAAVVAQARDVALQISRHVLPSDIAWKLRPAASA